MSKILFSYDELSDTMYIHFGERRPATGLMLNEDFVIRVDLDKRELVGLTILNYKLVSKEKEIPLTRLADLDQELVEWVLKALRSKPLNQLLHLIDEQRVSPEKMLLENKVAEARVEELIM